MTIITQYFPWVLNINFVSGVTTFLIGVIVLKILSMILIGGLNASKANKSLVGIVGSLAGVVMWFFLGAVTLAALGFGEAATILSFIGGAFALAAGFGSQNIVANLTSGFMLASDHDFGVGFTVKIANVEGVVNSMDFRKVRIKDAKGFIHVFPNKFVEDNPWELVKKSTKEIHD